MHKEKVKTGNQNIVTAENTCKDSFWWNDTDGNHIKYMTKQVLIDAFHHHRSNESITESEPEEYHTTSIQFKEEDTFRVSNGVCLNVIASVDENMCIGKDNLLPWDLPSEFQYFLSMTSKPKPGLQNVVIVGRSTWNTMDKLTSKPFPNSFNIVLTRNDLPEAANYDNTIVAHSMEEAMDIAKKQPNIDEVWVIGGAETYSSAMQTPNFHRLYLTHIHAKYGCDTHFPFMRQELEYGRSFRKIPQNEINDPRVPVGVQTDPKDGIKFEVMVYGKRNF